jgi:hypothetical protein
MSYMYFCSILVYIDSIEISINRSYLLIEKKLEIPEKITLLS